MPEEPFFIAIFLRFYIPIPVEYHFKGYAFTDINSMPFERTNIDIKGVYRLKVLGGDEFVGQVSCDSVFGTKSDTIVVTLHTNYKFLMPIASVVFFSETGQNFLRFRNIEVIYSGPFLSSVAFTSQDPNDSHVIVGPAANEQEALALVKKLIPKYFQ